MSNGFLHTRGAMVIAIFVAAMLCGNQAVCAATIEEVDAEISKANKTLQDMSAASERAKTLTAAIESLHGALEMLEKVPGLSADQAESKASQIMATIFWCKKMMPLDMTGRSLDTAPVTANKGPSSGDEKSAAAETKTNTPQVDEIAFNRVKDYATKNPLDLQGVVERYASVAASFPQSKWGERAAQEATQSRTKLNGLLAESRKTSAARLHRLELTDLLASLEKDIGAEKVELRKTQLSQMKKEVEQVNALYQKLVTSLEPRLSPLNIPAEELGAAQKGWVKSAKKTGVFMSQESKDAPAASAPVAWSDFGAKAMVRLAEKTLTLDVPTLEMLCISATVTEDYIAANRLFVRLLNAAPQRVKDLTTYFERAQSGYKNDGEGSARIRLAEVKELVKKRNYPDAMARLTEIQKDLAKSSTLQNVLAEMSMYRRSLRLQFEIDDAGGPITQFERVMRKVFAGDAHVDEATGNIDVSYDFNDPSQTLDWTFKANDWALVKGRMECAGKNTILVWKYPISRFTVSADVIYRDESRRVMVHGGMSNDRPKGIWAHCLNGAGRVTNGGTWWYSSARFVWRAGESATLRYTQDSDKGEFVLAVNGQYAVSGKFGSGPGSIGFGFDGGAGSVDNVHIKGKLDMDLLKKIIVSGK